MNKNGKQWSAWLLSLIVLVVMAGPVWGLSPATYRDGDKIINRDQIIQAGTVLAYSGAKRLEEFLQNAIETEALKVEDLFDEAYQERIVDTKTFYTSRFNDYFDQHLPELFSPFFDSDKVLFAFAMDRNGYVPTHLPDLAELSDRKREDEITKSIIGDQRVVHLEVYPTQLAGKKQAVFDFSSPVSIDGRFWGYFRTGLVFELGSR